MWGRLATRLATCAAVGYRRRSVAKAAGADCQSAAGYQPAPQNLIRQPTPAQFFMGFRGPKANRPQNAMVCPTGILQVSPSMVPFDPLFCSPHLQTIAGHLWKRPDAAAEFPVERRLYRTEPDVQVLVCSQRPHGQARGEIFMVHGLEGSGEAGYIRSLSTAALRAGFAAHRFHMRTCGGTEHLCRTLYHAGLTSDLLAVLREFRRDGCAPAFLVGFSLGGNVVLKLAGEMGELAGVRSVFELDDRFTAPSFGFGDAANYYRTQSAIGYLAGLRVPALLI